MVIQWSGEASGGKGGCEGSLGLGVTLGQLYITLGSL